MSDPLFHLTLISSCILLIILMSFLFTMVVYSGRAHVLGSMLLAIFRGPQQVLRRSATAIAVTFVVGFFLVAVAATAVSLVTVRAEKEAVYVDVKAFHDKNLNKLVTVAALDLRAETPRYNTKLELYRAMYWVFYDYLYVHKVVTVEHYDRREGLWFTATSRVGLGNELQDIGFRMQLQEKGSDRWEEVSISELDFEAHPSGKKILLGIPSSISKNVGKVRFAYVLGEWDKNDPLSMIYFNPKMYKYGVKKTCIDTFFPQGTNYEELKVWDSEGAYYDNVEQGGGEKFSESTEPLYIRRTLKSPGELPWSFWMDTTGEQRGFSRTTIGSREIRDPLILLFAQKVDYSYTSQEFRPFEWDRLPSSCFVGQ